MDIRNSPLWNVVLEVQASPTSGVKKLYNCDFLVDGDRRPALKLMNFIIARKYTGNHSDVIKVKVAIAASTYANFLVPNKDRLIMTLYPQPQTESGNFDSTKEIEVEEFTAQMLESEDPLMTPAANMPSNDDALDLGNFVTIWLQLIPKASVQLRSFMIGGTHYDIVPGELLKQLFTEYSARVSVAADHQVIGVDMVPPDNQTKRKQIQIPDGTALVDLPDFLQNREGGIYNSGIDYYLQQNLWYVWPQYGLDRHNTRRKVLNLYNLPNTALPGSEKTFAEAPGQVTILATGASTYVDLTEKLDQNAGNGIRFVDAAKLIGKAAAVVRDNKMVVQRAAALTEFVTELKPTGLQIAKFSRDLISDNPFRQVSQMSSSKGFVVTVVWENADPYLLYPGMPTNFFVQRGEELIEKKAILIDAIYHGDPNNNGMIFSYHLCTASLTFFVAKEDKRRIDLSED